MNTLRVPPLTEAERSTADVSYVSPDSSQKFFNTFYHYGIWMPTAEQDGRIAVTETSNNPGFESGLLRGMYELNRYQQTALGPLLQHIGLWSEVEKQGERNTTSRAGLPGVSKLIERINMLEAPAGHELPKIAPFEGLRYSPEEGLRAIANDTLLISTQVADNDIAAAHDATVHIPVWHALPPVVREQCAREAQGVLDGTYPYSFGRHEEPYAAVMQNLDVAISFVGIGRHLQARDYMSRQGLAFTYSQRLHVPGEDVGSLVEQTFDHVAVLGDIATRVAVESWAT